MTDPPAWEALLRAQTGRLAFDVGANWGQSARVLAPNFERVVCFEPCTESFEILQMEKQPNVDALNWAASNEAGKLILFENEMSIKTGQLTAGHGLEEHWGEIVGQRVVTAVTLNQMAERFGTPELVKVDVEGFEVPVLEGAADLMGYSEWLIEVHDRGHEEPLYDLLFGYMIRRYDHDSADHFYLAATL